jgi:hypothetical protein
MKIREIILEMAQDAIARLTQAKTVIASKIKQLPDDEATVKALRDIEELLQYVGAGGRKGMIDKKLQEIGDPAVDAFRKELARYLLSILDDKTQEERDELFNLWKSDQLVKIDVLLNKKMNSFEQIFTGYGKNSATTEFIDDLMQVQFQGQGKGELALNVLSKSVHKPGSYQVNQDEEEKEELKGDLVINGKKIELKTKDKGAARFTDQEVKPAPGYEAAAMELRNFISANRSAMPGVRVVKSGINAGEAIHFYAALQDKKLKAQYLELVKKSLILIFGGKEKADMGTINELMNAVKNVNIPEFLQLFSNASLAYYLSIKKDEGVLSVDIPKKQCLFYSSAEDLAKVKQRFHAETFYLGNNNPREVYPKLSVMPTTFVADPEGRAKQKAARAQVAALPSAEDPVEIQQALEDVVTDLASAKGVTDPAKIQAMFNSASDWLASQKTKLDKIKPNSLEQHLEAQGFFNDEKPDELDTIVKNAGITKPAAPTTTPAAKPGQATV